ncbi:enoyl-CoA hydratase/isomerase family protein [Sandaracinus amylolyticus]|uniref:Enoyl-CoA hydratase n=1 Tax=Sandaracinus amylolyticus TaxID=927083 RepID=A0A0F6YN89_9BACT|nr:enoyl-CoA hydratase-related protein [Sandaracinus amylolyticus]AKF10176.1 Enoyl-CoA hydratase [Sandaracinus amylolyticus]
MNDVLRVEDHGAVRVLTLSRPEKKNAFDVALTEALWSALERASADESVRVVVVTGAGDMFSAGADVNLFLQAGTGGLEGDISKVARLYEPLRACTKPVIAAVQGPTVGMGVTMLPHFDLVYAAEHATFLVPFVRLGLVVEYAGSFALPRLIGHQRTRELLLRAKPIDARTAEHWGLVTRVFPRESFTSEVMAIANDVAALPPGAILECRRLVDKGEQSDMQHAIDEENRVLATRYGSAENVDAVKAFLTRRK